mgnify:FL=1
MMMNPVKLLQICLEITFRKLFLKVAVVVKVT